MYWPNVGAYGTSVNLTYPPIWKFQYTCARTNVHACTNVSLDKSILGHKMSLDNFGQKSARTNVSLDNSLLGQKSPWTKVPWTNIPWTKVSLDKSLVGQKSPRTKVSLDNRPLDNCRNTLQALGIQHTYVSRG